MTETQVKDILKKQIFLENLPSFLSFCKKVERNKEFKNAITVTYIGTKDQMLEDIFSIQEEYAIQKHSPSCHFSIIEKDQDSFLLKTDIPPEYLPEFLSVEQPDMEMEL